jgi:hypothetical protein
MDRYKEDTGGQGTTDIIHLFNYWQSNYGQALFNNQMKTTMNDDKTLINYNSKSFNNKTYVGGIVTGGNRETENSHNEHHNRDNNRQISLEVSPINGGNAFNQDDQFNLE